MKVTHFYNHHCHTERRLQTSKYWFKYDLLILPYSKRSKNVLNGLWQIAHILSTLDYNMPESSPVAGMFLVARMFKAGCAQDAVCCYHQTPVIIISVVAFKVLNKYFNPLLISGPSGQECTVTCLKNICQTAH